MSVTFNIWKLLGTTHFPHLLRKINLFAAFAPSVLLVGVSGGIVLVCFFRDIVLAVRWVTVEVLGVILRVLDDLVGAGSFTCATGSCQ